MRHRAPPIARIRLARSLPRLLAMPVLVLAIGFTAVAAWALGFADREVGAMALAVLGAVLALAAIAAVVILLSLRLEVRESSIRLAWLGGERHHALSPGPVTRVRLLGPDASRLRPRFGMLGWAVGPARLRDEEDVQVVRLARTRTAILVPTDRGRLAIAAADEEELLDALSRAARARQRLESIGPLEDVPEPVTEPPGTTVELEPRILTGIERALLEQRLAEDGTAASTAQPEPAQPEAGPRGAGRRGIRLGRPRPSLVFASLPLLAAGAAWGIGVASGTYPDPATDAGRLTALALVLAGPATSVGAIMAWTWWPRLVGVVVFGGLAASVFIGRALLG